jgi:glycosyltransferase involved in cell wall biosynthesis
LHALTGIPVVQTWHQYHTGLKGSLRNLLNAAIGGGLVVVEPDYQQQLPPWFRHLIRRKRFRYIPNSSNIPFVELSESERGSIRARIAPGADRVVTFFGFAYPSKGIELLFEVADPSKHYLVLVCDLDASDPYHRQILALTQGAWQGKVTITGFLPPEEVARVLAASDAAVLPFREGAGMRNASIHATTLQGTVVVTTSREGQGYVEAENIFYCKPGDIAAMRQALDLHMGRKSATVSMNRRRDWEHIAEAHLQLYREVTGRSSTPA